MECSSVPGTGHQVNNMAAKFVPILAVICDDTDNCDILYGDDESVVVPFIVASILREERFRIQSYTEQVVPCYLLDDFKRFFRVSRSTFEILHENISPYRDVAPGWTGGREPIPMDKQLLMMMWYISSHETLNRIADRFNVTESSTVRCRDRLFKVFNEHLKEKFISWPQGNDKAEIVRGFARKANFPDVVGAIDGTHIRIKAPSQHPESFVNRKGFHSVILQAVCREDMRFIHVVAGWPGSCHDARVLKNCDLWDEGPARCGDAHIIGDAAYPIRKWLLTPYRNNGHLSRQQQLYNTALSTTRVTVERAFGMFKGRFPRLQCVVTKKIKTTVDLIVTCCILHNICILNEDEVSDHFEDDHNNLPQDGVLALQGMDEVEGLRKREYITRNL